MNGVLRRIDAVVSFPPLVLTLIEHGVSTVLPRPKERALTERAEPRYTVPHRG